MSIFNYVTEQSFDIYIWQTLESKARFIAQIMMGNVTARTAEDVDDLVMTAAQVKAIATGNPRILEKVSIEVELSRLSRLYQVWRNSRRHMRYEIGTLQERIRETDQRVAWHEQAVAVRNAYRAATGEKVFTIELRQSPRSDQWRTFNKRAQAGDYLEKLRRDVELLASVEPHRIGSYCGFEVFAQRQRFRNEELFDPVAGFLKAPGEQMRYAFNYGDSAQGTLQSIDAALRKLDLHLQEALRTKAELRHKHEQIGKVLSSGWEYAGRYEEFREKLNQVNQVLTEGATPVDDKQDFINLDQEAYQRCDRDDEPGSCLVELSIADEVGADIPEQLAPTPSLAAEKSEITSESDHQSSPPVVTVEEPQCTQPHIMIEDLRQQKHQQDEKPKQRHTYTSSDDQMTLW